MGDYTLAPLLTERDPRQSSEGGIDPLGLAAIADALGVRLVPGVRERQAHPRFLTAIATSLAVCAEFDEDTIAADRVSEPWQVFEWYLVEGLVRTSEDAETTGLPGSLKAWRALEDGMPLSAKRYLKTPSIFGFHGVYRLLARTLGIEQGGRLGEAGYELLNVWSKEQGLDGFVGTASGPGQAIRQKLTDAIRDGLDKGTTARSGGWDGWEFFRQHLAIYGCGAKEASFITGALLKDPVGFRREVIQCLVSEVGGGAWKGIQEERQFHEALRASASEDLRQLLDAISSYETFARLCQDAFDACLCQMTLQRGKIEPSTLSPLPAVQTASREAPKAFDDALGKLEAFGQASRFCDLFAPLAERGDETNWVAGLVEHHLKTQRQKPPNGRLPWFEQSDDGGLIIRPLYRRDEPPDAGDTYVHSYRTRSLWSFASDLRLIQS